MEDKMGRMNIQMKIDEKYVLGRGNNTDDVLYLEENGIEKILKVRIKREEIKKIRD